MKLSELGRKLSNYDFVRFHTKEFMFQIDTFTKEGKVSGYEIILRTTNKCNMNCGFCFVDKKIHFSEKAIQRTLAFLTSLELQGSVIIISGGEPTIRKDFNQMMKTLLSTKVNQILIQTNAAMFSNQAFLDKFPKDSRIKFFVSFPSTDKARYNMITNSKLYDNAMNGVKNISAQFPCGLNSVITSMNYKELPEMVKFIHENFYYENVSLYISNLGSMGRFQFKPLLVKYTELIPSLREAFDLAEKYNLQFRITDSGGCAFPLCIINKVYTISENVFFKSYSNLVGFNSLEKQFFKNDECKECRYNENCNGFPTEYVRKYTDSEIHKLH